METSPLARPSSKRFTFLYFINLLNLPNYVMRQMLLLCFLYRERELRCKEYKKIAQCHREQVRKVGSIQTQAVWLWNSLLLPLCHGLCQTFLPRWTLPQNNRFGGRWSNVLYNRKGETQRKTNNKTDLASHQRKPFPAPALLWMPGFISVVGTGEERLVILGMCCLCAWGQSHYGLPFQPEVGSRLCHWERLGGTLSPRIHAITLPSLERPPAGWAAGSIARAISTSLYKSSTRAANRRCWIKSVLLSANQMAPQHKVPSFLGLIKLGWMRQWCHEICIYLVHLTLPIMMMECFPHVGALLAPREDRKARWRLVVGQANQSQEEE